MDEGCCFQLAHKGRRRTRCYFRYLKNQVPWVSIVGWGELEHQAVPVGLQPGDKPSPMDVRANLSDGPPGGVLLVIEDKFKEIDFVCSCLGRYELVSAWRVHELQLELVNRIPIRIHDGDKSELSLPDRQV